MSEKGKAILAYIFGWIGGLIVLFAIKDSERNTKIHAAQSIVISLGYMLIRIIYSFIPITIPFFSTILWGIYAVAIIVGIVNAAKEQEPEIPVIGDVAKSIFAKTIGQ